MGAKKVDVELKSRNPFEQITRRVKKAGKNKLDNDLESLLKNKAAEQNGKAGDSPQKTVGCSSDQPALEKRDILAIVKGAPMFKDFKPGQELLQFGYTDFRIEDTRLDNVINEYKSRGEVVPAELIRIVQEEKAHVDAFGEDELDLEDITQLQEILKEGL